MLLVNDVYHAVVVSVIKIKINWANREHFVN